MVGSEVCNVFLHLKFVLTGIIVDHVHRRHITSEVLFLVLTIQFRCKKSKSHMIGIIDYSHHLGLLLERATVAL
jgi:hypothetical protein